MERAIILAGLAAALLAPAAAALSVDRPVPEGGLYLVAAPPWADAAAVARQAGGQLVGPLEAPFGVLVTSEDPDFATRVRAGGAWMVADGAAVALICGG